MAKTPFSRHGVAIVGLVVDQRAEHRVAVEARKAAPDDAGAPVDQRGDRAIADHAEVERGGMRCPGRRRNSHRQSWNKGSVGERSPARRRGAASCGCSRSGRRRKSPTLSCRARPRPAGSGAMPSARRSGARAGLAVADPDRQAAQRVDRLEAGLVGDVVADEDRHAPGKGRLLHQPGDRVALAGAGRDEFGDGLALLQPHARAHPVGEAAHQRAAPRLRDAAPCASAARPTGACPRR